MTTTTMGMGWGRERSERATSSERMLGFIMRPTSLALLPGRTCGCVCAPAPNHQQASSVGRVVWSGGWGNRGEPRWPPLTLWGGHGQAAELAPGGVRLEEFSTAAHKDKCQQSRCGANGGHRWVFQGGQRQSDRPAEARQGEERTGEALWPRNYRSRRDFSESLLFGIPMMVWPIRWILR